MKAAGSRGDVGGGRDGRVPNSPRLLDPHGIYGTRTANRMRVARRRRAVHNLMLAVLAMVAIAVFFAWRRAPRVQWLA
ncbi:MAG: hypothetical protein JWN98_700, partial [Abditibacteriota bacterium]|nr:hypothetical protein [Abditibacteriota bacterium]